MTDTAKTLLLAGNPNVGKSTLFNVLTGARQRIGNYPGVTVEKKIGDFQTRTGTTFQIVDLPGTYSLNAKTEDERIAVQCIAGEQPEIGRPDLVLVVGEAYHLDRALFLFGQIRELNPHAVLVLNMIDELAKSDKSIDVAQLQKLLGAPVFAISATTGAGLAAFKDYFETLAIAPAAPGVKPRALQTFADIDAVVSAVVTRKAQKAKSTASQTLDRWFLHPVLGPIFFVVIMVALFQSLFSWSAPLMDGIEALIGILSGFAGDHLPDGIVKSVVVDGILGGVGSVVVFVPQIAVAFLLIGFLESSGYLSRGAFLIDRLMRVFGLEGRSFIPLVSSFACAVPGILATRTIPNPKQRLLTILVAPLMTCSARLPVYTLLIATFVPVKRVWGFLNLQGLVLLGLFCLGLVAALAVSFFFQKILKTKTTGASFVMELPRYRLPQWKNLYLYTGTKVLAFLKTAGTVIFFLSLVLWALAYFPHPQKIHDDYEAQRITIQTQSENPEADITALDSEEAGAYLRQSYMGRMGHALEPVFKPMGADWRMGIGLISSFAAREVFVSTLGIVFNLGDVGEDSESLHSILQNSKNADGTPTYTLATALAVLVFFALAAQCLSTLAVIKRETNSLKWAFVSFGYMSVLAYAAAVLTFQMARALM